MERFRAEMESVDETANRIASKTTYIIKLVMVILSLASLVLIYLVYSMSTHLAIILTHLDNMYSEFGIMSANMQEITHSVENIGGNISGMPLIAKNMNNMSADMGGMVGSVKDIKTEMLGMNHNTGSMSADTGEMANRFDSLNRSVHHIGYNINQMGKPIP